ncbi:hypothetical protein [Streptomyces sp. NPDC052042]|uniref:hypothetical protein n=1 Tax=Streptomyces sp. NPDC052042 TaxID=3365683 RepID=UPI0037D0177E
MFQDVPIYHQLVAERGDIPARVRDAATFIYRQLEDVKRTGRPPVTFEPGPQPPDPVATPQSALPPGQQPPR